MKTPTRKATWTMGGTRRTMAALRALDLRATIAEVQNSQTLSPIQKDDCIARLDILVEVAQRHHAGKPITTICRCLGISTHSIHRWLLDYQKDGPTGLASDYSQCGRKPSVSFTPDEEAEFLKIYAATVRRPAVRNATKAMQLFAEKHSGLSDFLARQKSKHGQPSAVRNAVAKFHANQ